MLNQLRIDGDGKEKGIEDFDDLDDEDSDDEGTGWNLVKSYASQTDIKFLSSDCRFTHISRLAILSFWDALDFMAYNLCAIRYDSCSMKYQPRTDIDI